MNVAHEGQDPQGALKVSALNVAVLIFGVDVEAGLCRCEDVPCAVGESEVCLPSLPRGNLLPQPEGNGGNFVHRQSLLLFAVCVAR